MLPCNRHRWREQCCAGFDKASTEPVPATVSLALCRGESPLCYSLSLNIQSPQSGRLGAAALHIPADRLYVLVAMHQKKYCRRPSQVGATGRLCDDSVCRALMINERHSRRREIHGSSGSRTLGRAMRNRYSGHLNQIKTPPCQNLNPPLILITRRSSRTPIRPKSTVF